MKWMSNSLTNKLIILFCGILAINLFIANRFQSFTYSAIVSIALLLVSSFIVVIAIRITVNKEKEKIEKIELAIKSAASGNYHTRISFSEEDQHASVYLQFNELMEEVEQKLAILQALGEERVTQEATTVESAVHEERKRLARDLHDTVSQQLFAIQMSSASLLKLHGQNEEAMIMIINQLVKMSTTAQTQMRKLIAHLRPMELVNQTLSNALIKWYPDYCRQNQIQGHLDNRLLDGLTEAKEHQIFMIIQEAMANVVKHAVCQNCYLSLYETDGQIHIELKDDGKGFDVTIPTTSSYGLITMQERAKKLGGSTEIMSKPGRGTVVKVAIPKLISGGKKDERTNVS